MCIGIPRRVLALDEDGSYALCGSDDGTVDGNGETLRVDLRLVGPQPVGTWVLDFNGAARRVLDATEAAQIGDAVQALAAALRGDLDGIDALFADLVSREPELPPHLRPVVDADRRP